MDRGDETVGRTEALTITLKGAQSEEEAPPLTLLAEWALWGKDERDTGYHVMRCSKGDLTAEVFGGIIRRYQSGVKPNLPQYTVCWIPGPRGDPEYLAVEISEVIEPGAASAGGRSRNVGGRVVEYVRVFCFRYADVAELEASYTELVRAVADIPLLEGYTDLIPVELTSGPEPDPPSQAERQLAADVAVLLLAGNPVCVLDADGVSAERRLAFIDLVMSLLPFGLRATLSASTSASTTTQDLRLRLYFSNAPREDGGRTSHVKWDRPGDITIPLGRKAALLYQEWLSEAGPGAIEGLTSKTDPVRFTEAEELQMLKRLPEDKSVAETLTELASKLRARDQAAVSTIVKRLKRYLASPQSSADRVVHRPLILKYGLFRDHVGIHGNVKASVYRTLLRLGFELPLSYASYCKIGDSAAGQLSLTLRQVLLDKRTDVFPFLLVALAEPGLARDQVRDALGSQDMGAIYLLGLLEQEMEPIRPQHRKDLVGFTLWCLRNPADVGGQWQAAENPRIELYNRGYLTGLLHRAFPKDQTEQQRRLADILRYIYGERLGQRQVIEIFEAPQLYPGPAFEAAVKRLAPQRRRFVERQAAAARLRNSGLADDVAKVLQPVTWGRHWPGLAKPAIALVIGLVVVGIALLALLLT